jgi:hypothetical protein
MLAAQLTPFILLLSSLSPVLGYFGIPPLEVYREEKSSWRQKNNRLFVKGTDTTVGKFEVDDVETTYDKTCDGVWEYVRKGTSKHSSKS